jgi:type I restriction enzyme S subunit
MNRRQQKALLTKKAIKRQPDPLAVKSSDHPWSLPEGWAWTRLGYVTNYGNAPKIEFDDVFEDTWVLELEDIEKGTSRLLAKVCARDRKFKSTKNGFPAGAVLYGKLRPYLDKVLIADAPGVCTTEISPISFFDQIDAGYLRWYLKSPYFIAYADGSTYGMNLPRLGTDSAREALFPFPPQREQAHIVAKVDELMALCDRLEKHQQDRRKLQNALRKSTLQALASAESPHELQESWQRLQANFGQLVSEPSDVDDVVAELKNLAVRGHLETISAVPVNMVQIKSDCSELRVKYIASGLMRRQKLVGQAESDVSYPDHWCVTAFDEVAVIIGGVTKGRNLRGKKTIACPYLSVANVQRGYFKLTSLKSIEIGEDERTKYTVHEGDLLITEGGDWDKVGRTAIWRGGVQNCLHQNHVFKARVPSDHILNEWVELVFNSGDGRDYFAGAAKQTTNLASINMTQLRGFPLPVPPLDEQRRILKKLADLSTHCNTWRDQLDKKAKLSSLFASVVVADLTGIEFEQKEEAVKAPQTELIALLRLGTLPDVKDQAPLATFLARHKGEMSARDLWQRFGGEIDAFYAQLKTEVAHGWITEPSVAEVRAKTAETAGG